MAADKDFKADITTSASFLQARTALDGEEKMVLLDFEMIDFDPSPTTVALKRSLRNVQKLVHTCLKALESLGDQPASVLLKVLNEKVPAQNRRTSA